MKVVLGVDVGTQGVRALAATASGDIVAQSQRPFEASERSAAGVHEQDALQWWAATAACLRAVVEGVRRAGARPQDIAAICVDSTSGTIVPVSERGEPLANAIMYNDSRAAAEADEINAVASEHCRVHGYRFSSSFALAKILWMKKHRPHLFDRAWKIIHAADYICGVLTGDFSQSDFSSALKTGCDLVNERWPSFIEEKLGIPLAKLPALGSAGRVLAAVSSKASEETGLSTNTKVCAGMTDGTAAFLASGARRVGDFNSTLGTTLVLKGIWEKILVDSMGRIYSHKHPAGWWLPGGASNVGGECLAVRFSGKDLPSLDRAALRCVPTEFLIYPLMREGERLPFVNARATGFIADLAGFLNGPPGDEIAYYAAHLEGVAYVERMCYEVMESLGATVNPVIYATGAAARSQEWLKIRASVLNRPFARPAHPDSAFGACVLAAKTVFYGDMARTVEAMVKLEKQFEPESKWTEVYEQRYRQFQALCRQKGYIG